jgi:GNAT superfamily N-acetyltransferase
MSIEYSNFTDDTYNSRAEAALDFLHQEVYGEPCNPFPEAPIPAIFTAEEDGSLIAAAGVGDSITYVGQPLLQLMGVVTPQRAQGVGTQLLNYVEKTVAQNGSQLLYITTPLSVSSEKFFSHRGYMPTLEAPGYFVKVIM